MRKVLSSCAALILLAATAQQLVSQTRDWAMNTTVIEACTCPMFCQCYFASKPAGHQHGGQTTHFCRFNNAYKINKGNYGATKLDGAKFWLSGDLGGDFSMGKMDWVVVTFDKATHEGTARRHRRDAAAPLPGEVELDDDGRRVDRQVGVHQGLRGGHARRRQDR